MFDVHFNFRLRKELQLQEEKKDRASKSITKLTRNIRSAHNTKNEIYEERDIELREMRNFNKNIMNQFGMIIKENPGFGPVINLYFNQAGLPLPTVATTSGSARPMSSSSRGSSIYSGRYVEV